MREYDPVITYQPNMERFLSHEWNKYDNAFSETVIKYFFGDYNDYIKSRAKELSLKTGFLFKLKMFIANPLMFQKHEDQWSNIRKFIKQTYYFTGQKDRRFYISFENEYFDINKEKFNIIKNFWQPYIDYLINKDETLKMQKKVKDF
tara:strand:- start:9917 stop:10357 length:441 start_codon:yes stop_codon:yes gene_type:complete